MELVVSDPDFIYLLYIFVWRNKKLLCGYLLLIEAMSCISVE